LRAGRDHLEEASASCNLAAAAAGRASARRRPSCAAAAAASGTSILARKLNGFLSTLRDFIKRQFDGGLKVISPRRPGLSAGTSASAAEYSAEEIVKAEHTEYVFDVHSGIIVHPHTAKAFVAELVVSLTFLWVAEHLVGLGAFLEFGFSLFVAGIFVGVIFDRQTPIRTLYIVCGGVFAHPQNFVIIPLGHIFVYRSASFFTHHALRTTHD
jgi:hypothetical protein